MNGAKSEIDFAPLFKKTQSHLCGWDFSTSQHNHQEASLQVLFTQVNKRSTADSQLFPNGFIASPQITEQVE